ncbi:uncharacterized protein MONBRDRAFT_30731 [Monosiga brevicollis MX1]|uniref:Sugar phosphate phosphatase n=1 Tax=Monosiga brevicollis TaxID=81824 RepID=A9UNV0_MONBE|nr:uncharacterized protein MONBRDRAFT_30731 [Monosiga brevicollis MX1]EDQ92306.1 predicted protein [Monosiga brevicollis MX1]|eukprot:XP_001742068.1 hypothetical protein [Monosiga brevicollis MX1]
MAASETEAVEEAPALTFIGYGAFGEDTLRVRMPTILTKAIDFMYRRLHAPDASTATDDEEASARRAIGILSKLKYEMQTGKPMPPIEDGASDQAAWNQALKEAMGPEGEPPRWWHAPWLLSECYMYRRIHQACAQAPLLADMDVFQEAKDDAFACSMESMEALGAFTLRAVDPEALADQASRRNAFEVMLQFSLWGNKSDLSLMAEFDGRTSLSHLQAGSEAHLQELRSFILQNDFEDVWDRLSTLAGARIDVVLDNSGFELFTDLCLAHWMTAGGYASTVHFHGKAMPWFVSDVTESDLVWTLNELGRQPAGSALQCLALQWKRFIRDGTWQFSAADGQTEPFVMIWHDQSLAKSLRDTAGQGMTGRRDEFWTYPHAFHQMAEVRPQLYSDLGQSQLILFKGDLNYRKLVGDRAWSPTTPFSKALQGFCPAPLCALRALKCNTVAGLTADKVDEAQAQEPNFMTIGRFAVVQFFDPSKASDCA